ncbi:MAG TPA: hypothetical protein VMU37_00230 [Caulobacteraceae bacterium]|nr:hypothetical protein [Caulobacteraceae bacterium]
MMLSAVVAAPLALWKGDSAARTAGIVSALNALILPISRMVWQQHVGEVVQLTADFVSAIALLMLVVRFAYRWLGVTMLLQAVQFSLHAYYLVMERAPDHVHAWINNLDTAGISLSIAAGTILASRRRDAFAREAAELEARRRQRGLSAA